MKKTIKLPRFRLRSFIGLAGVADHENALAQKVGHKFEIPMLLAAMWIVVEWYSHLQGLFPESYAHVSDLAIWILFISETSILAYLVTDKLYYLRTNWINLVIILVGIPVIWGISSHVGILRSLRLLLLVAILVNLSDTIRQVLSRNHLGITLAISFVIILLGGILIAGIDPSINTIWEGLWWAWVTVTTVGYGDIVPSSVAGKLFGALLILLGIGLFSLLTANFSAFFISKEEKESKNIARQTLDKLNTIEEKLTRIEQDMEKLKKQ